MDKRNAMRAGAVTAAATLMMLMSSPAMALVRDDGDDPGTGLSVGETLGLFVALPIVSFLVIAGLCMIPGRKK
ncbi:photosystem II reaction center protein PsbW [Kitasatospora sp. NPDC004531]